MGYFLSPSLISQKIAAFSHTELNRHPFNTVAWISAAKEEGYDLFNRTGEEVMAFNDCSGASADLPKAVLLNWAFFSRHCPLRDALGRRGAMSALSPIFAGRVITIGFLVGTSDTSSCLGGEQLRSFCPPSAVCSPACLTLADNAALLQAAPSLAILAVNVTGKEAQSKLAEAAFFNVFPHLHGGVVVLTGLAEAYVLNGGQHHSVYNATSLGATRDLQSLLEMLIDAVVHNLMYHGLLLFRTLHSIEFWSDSCVAHSDFHMRDSPENRTYFYAGLSEAFYNNSVVYERYLAPLVGKARVRVLDLRLCCGTISIALWQRLFGDALELTCLEFDSTCSPGSVPAGVKVLTVQQLNNSLLAGVMARGPFHIIVDDRRRFPDEANAGLSTLFLSALMSNCAYLVYNGHNLLAHLIDVNSAVVAKGVPWRRLPLTQNYFESIPLEARTMAHEVQHIHFFRDLIVLVRM